MYTFTDTCEDFNDSENRDGLTVVLAHTFRTIISFRFTYHLYAVVHKDRR